MTSLPTTFTFGSATSSQSVRDAIASFRRAQYFAAGSTVQVTTTDTEDFSDGDEEAAIRPICESDDEADASDDNFTSTQAEQTFIDEFEWDDDEDVSESQGSPQVLRTNRERLLYPPSTAMPAADIPAMESTPLLRKAVSFSTTPHPRRQSAPSPMVNAPQAIKQAMPPALIRRRSSGSSSKSGRYSYGGKSTFGQTLFNSIAILLGIGMLSEPLAFAYSGWVTGTALILSYGFISCYTAKILARIILADPRLRSYADIGRKAFGPRSTSLISVMFCLELFAVSVILVTLYADSLHIIMPQHSTTTYKLWGILLLIPTVFLPLSLLSYTSILGIVSSLLVILVVLIDGFSKPDPPGSFWSPAETNMGVNSWNKLGLAFGLFMAGFSGHAVIPSLARDMVDPSQFDVMIDWAFAIATFLYALIGYAGYLMFGRYVSDEISMDLLRTPGYNQTLNKTAVWMLVVSPLSKFALTTQPLNATIEILLSIDTPLPAPESLASKSNGLTIAPTQGSNIALKRFFAISQRVLVTVLSVVFSILIPEFSSVMAFLGAFSAFMLCVIGPISAKIMLAGHCSIFDAGVLGLGIVMAIWGTMAAFLPQ